MSINLITFEIIKQYLERHGGSGSNIEIESLSITENGTYTASTGYAYNPVSVNVPAFEPAGTMIINENGTFDVAQYSAASVNIPIPPQPSGTLSISENGVYDVASYASANVSVAGGGITYDDIAMQMYNSEFVAPIATIIVSNAFRQNAKITSVAFPACSLIGNNAFLYCSNLKNVSFPVCELIGDTAFYSCALESVSFSLCKVIMTGAFSDCRNLHTAVFTSCENISNYAFAGCKMLTELHLEGVNSVPLLSNISAFRFTPIVGSSATAGRYGSVFVPASLYQSFLTASNWSNISSRIVSV